ncbi:MAG: FkbM family methyltransferase [Dehalococcoidia bacterium]|nr:FkbM family methyltransferase [Dehalococcoidia bacterium]
MSRTYRFLTRRLIGEDIISVVVHGQKMHVNATFGLTLQSTGTYISERLMSNLFIELLKEGMVVVDIGAHVGYYTLLAAKAVGDKGKVFCFEPGPANYVLLLKNIEENNCNNIVPVQKAVSKRTGPIKLFIAKDPSGHSIASDNPHQKAIVVDSITIDEFFAGREYPIHVIKIDVEGAEMAVLQGMRNIIAKNRRLNIFTEFNPGALKRVGFSPTEYFQMLVDFGFNICVINEQKQSLEPAEINTVMAMCKSIEYVNLLCRKV